MSKLILEERTPNQNPRQMRASGFVPVTVYGRSLENSLSLKTCDRTFRKMKKNKFHQSFEADILGKPAFVVVKNIQIHPVTDVLENIELQLLAEGETTILDIPIVYVGTSPLVQAGGTMFINKKSVKLRVGQKNIPSSIEFPLSKLSGNTHFIYYRDLELPEGVELADDETQIIVKASVPTVAK